jgi:hypothetical protein
MSADTGDVALEVARFAGNVGRADSPDVKAARAAFALHEPAGGIRRRSDGGVGVGDAAVAAELREGERVLYMRDHVGSVAEQRPAPRDAGE